MSIKCSLFGCTYGETETHREREEDGSEVVITIRETETCSRCGDVRVVSENKEVTTLETAADIVADDLEEDAPADHSPASGAKTRSPESGPEPEPGPEPERGPESGESTPDDDSTVIPDAETDDVVTAGGDNPSAPEMPDPAAVEDDGVILDDSDGDDGEWPGEPADSGGDDEDRGPGGPSGRSDGYESVEWPEEPDEDDEDRGSGGPSGRSDGYESVEWPEEPDEDGETRDPHGYQPIDDGPGTDEVGQFGSSGNTVSATEGEFYCPDCGYATPVESSSLRVGDYCPECDRGALEQRTE